MFGWKELKLHKIAILSCCGIENIIPPIKFYSKEFENNSRGDKIKIPLIFKYYCYYIWAFWSLYYVFPFDSHIYQTLKLDYQ